MNHGDSRRAALAGYLERLDRALAQLDQGQPPARRRGALPVDIGRAECEMGRKLPQPLRELYELSDGCEAFWFFIPPASLLGVTQDQTRSIIELFRPGGPDEDLVESPTNLTGSVITISDYDGWLLLYMTDGPDADTLWVFPRDEIAFFQVAPSLESLLECWVTVAELGLAKVEHAPGGPDFMALQETAADAAADALSALGCRPEALRL